MNEKIMGYFLLFFGIITIISSAISVYLVFTGNQQPVELFKGGGISLNLSQMLGSSLTANQIMPANLPTQELISAEYLNKTTNLFIHIILMGFIASAGFKIAQIGTYLLRPIEVKLKNEPVAVKSAA